MTLGCAVHFPFCFCIRIRVTSLDNPIFSTQLFRQYKGFASLLCKAAERTRAPDQQDQILKARELSISFFEAHLSVLPKQCVVIKGRVARL
jgi:hypothetical protein